MGDSDAYKSGSEKLLSRSMCSPVSLLSRYPLCRSNLEDGRQGPNVGQTEVVSRAYRLSR